MVGLLTDFEGDVRFQGRSIRNNKMMINKELGYLPQNIGFLEWRTVEHALTTFGRLSGISEHELDHTLGGPSSGSESWISGKRRWTSSRAGPSRR